MSRRGTTPARALRLIAVGVRTHVSYMSRSPIEITFAVLVPLVYATLAVYLFRASDDPDRLLTAAVGAGLMGIWSSVVWGAVLFDVPLDFGHPLLFLIAVPVCVMSLGMMGLLLAATFVLLRNANALANPLDAPVWMLSGMLVPATVLPEWTRPVSWALPTTWGSRAVHAATSGGTGAGEVLVPMAAALALGALYALGAVLVLGRVEQRAGRRHPLPGLSTSAPQHLSTSAPVHLCT
ncbi:ABC transporter permease [Streptomyces sp. ITFR-6]|uniref:ABC transporter permease n=1 Tax=Streptomyces sp. ITFR-6 TaxID=3075197 RepID=UPI00288AB0BF|nr:ABC transporter permease [Streptomyces sp. ITFR-6]WNI30958.1 ABC transporter permease [Streptomyces sp. ITFR-6]